MCIIVLRLVTVIDICVAFFQIPLETENYWSSWTPCGLQPGSRDTNCIGTQNRTEYTRDVYTHVIISTLGTQFENCLLTTEIVDGGLTLWSEWEDCSNKCSGRTSKYRYCNNPTPCNGGKTCAELGSDTQTKNCGPISGQWGAWEAWGSCTKAAGQYGTGTHIRYRVCNNPKPACQGDDCVGVNSDTGNCRAIPPCLTKKMFDAKFLRQDSPMILYTSAQVAIYLLTKNKCAPNIIAQIYYDLYKINMTSGKETQIEARIYNVKFKFNPGTLQIGMYRLYSRISYIFQETEHWMEESMYIKIVHPPPNAFIKGGSGKTVAEGNVYFDARSVSYSLTKGPGDPSGLTFQWICLNFVTKTIYNLLQFNIDPVKAFKDYTGYQKKWYETGFTGTIQNQVAFIEASDTFSNRVKYLRDLKTPCKTADQIYVKVQPNKIIVSPITEIYNTTSNLTFTTDKYKTITNDAFTTSDNESTYNFEMETTTPDPVAVTKIAKKGYDLIPLSTFYTINYLSEITKNPVPKYDTKYVLQLPVNDTLIMNQLVEFLSELYGFKFSTFAKDTVDFFELLSQSSLTLESLLQLRELNGLPASANDQFFNNLEVWLNISIQSKTSTNNLITLLEDFKYVQNYIKEGKDLINYAGIDGFLQLSIDSSGRCLLDYIGDIIEGFSTINNYDWNDMKQKEKFYMNWLEQELFISSACKRFTGLSDGTGTLTVTNDDATTGTGFLVYIRVEFEESISYFIQHAQSVVGSPKELELECRLNCMKKTALTSIMSLKAKCLSCTYDELLHLNVSWNVQDFDSRSRKAAENLYWTDWMLSAPNTSKFVMMANVLKPNTGYLIEAIIQVSGGEVSTGIWMVTTNILPYDGTCMIEDSDMDKKVIASEWKDEGFRSLRDPSIDWKEQLNYRIVQITPDGEETLLYYGAEQENYIKVKPGSTAENVTIKIHIFDIFIDFIECINNLGIITPIYTVGDDVSVSNFLDYSDQHIQYFWKIGNMKQVAMNSEVAGTPLSDLTVPKTIFDTDPSEWIYLGVQKSDGMIVIKTFEELWEMYQNPDLGNTTTTAGIINKLVNFSNILSNVSDDIDGTSTVNIAQIATSMGTILTNKDYATHYSASNAFKGNKDLIEKLVKLTDYETYPKYEDYLSTCEGVLSVLNNALEAILPKSSKNTPIYLDIYSIMDDLSIRMQLNNLSEGDLTLAEKAFLASRIAMKNELDAQIKNEFVQKLVPVLIESISRLGHVLHKMSYRKQMPVYVQNAYINTTVDQKLISDLVKKGIESNGVAIQFNESYSKSTNEQNVQVTIFDHTPFSWDIESKYISSKTVTISVSEGISTKTVIPSKIKFPTSDILPSLRTISVAIPTENNESTSQMLLYKLYWKNPKDSLIVTVKSVINHLKHVVYIRKKEMPTKDVHDWNKTITADDFITHDEIKVVVDGDLYSEASLVYVGVLVSSERSQNLASALGRRKRSTVLSTPAVVEYHIIGITTGCRVWNENLHQWDKTSCKISGESTVNEIICECTNPPGNSFATTFYVPPNTIDFDSVFDKFDLINNAAVFSTVICLVSVYLMICVWAHRQDRKDHDRWAVSYLVDNAPFNEYLYLVTVYTGLYRHAGTNSNVMFMIIDANTMGESSECRILDDGLHKGFGIGSVKRFVMSVEKRIADPSVLKIWHDNSGIGHKASWYLDKVVLEDIQTEDKYIFICKQWLSLDHDEGRIEIAIPVSDKADQKKFSFLFNEKTRQNTTDSHLWLSVAFRPEESNFTRFERVACCLALLFLTMISNAMFFGRDTGNTISLGPISFSLTGLYISFISALISTPPIFIVTYIFRNSKQWKIKQTNDLKGNDSKQTLLTEQEERKKHEIKDADTKRNVFADIDPPLPFWCRYIAWGIIVLAVLTSGFFLILYSMEWGKTKSEDWLLCFFFSFFESVFIVDPTKIILISVVLSWIYKNNKDQHIIYNKEKLLAEVQERTSSPVQYLIDFYRERRKTLQPLKQQTITDMRKQRRTVLQVQRTFKELIVYLIFLFVLYTVSFSNRDTRWFYFTQHLEEQLVQTAEAPGDAVTIRFNQISSASDLYAWLGETLTPFMFPRFATNGVHLNAYQRLYTDDAVNFRLGPLRLRQLRTKKKSCIVNLWDDTQCFDEYSVLEEDDIDYCVGWESGPCIRGQDVYNITSAAWRFVSSVDNWGLPSTGLYTTYGGGGYIMEFVVNYNISISILSDLYKYMWIDRQTRAVFIEFTLFNVDENVFMYVSFLCEFPETGGVITSTSIKPLRPYQHIGSVGVIIFVFELIVLVGITILAVLKVLYIYRHGCKVLKELWNALDIIIILLFLICTAIYIGRWIMINYAMEKLKTNKNKFVNFSHIASWDELFNIFLAFIIFLTTLRIMRILNYNPIMNQLGNVLRSVGHDLLGCFVVFFIVYAAFVMVGYLIFGRYLETYKNILVSSTTLVNAVIGKNSINDLFSVEPI